MLRLNSCQSICNFFKLFLLHFYHFMLEFYVLVAVFGDLNRRFQRVSSWVGQLTRRRVDEYAAIYQSCRDSRIFSCHETPKIFNALLYYSRQWWLDLKVQLWLDFDDLNVQKMKQLGVSAVAIDKDNCITKPYEQNVYQPFKVRNHLFQV